MLALNKENYYGDVVFSKKGDLMYVNEKVKGKYKPASICVYRTARPFVAEKAKEIYKWNLEGANGLTKNYNEWLIRSFQFNDDGSKVYLLTTGGFFVNKNYNPQFKDRHFNGAVIRQFGLSTNWDLRTTDITRREVIDRTDFMPDADQNNAFGDRHFREIIGFQIVDSGKKLILNTTRGAKIDPAAGAVDGIASFDDGGPTAGKANDANRAAFLTATYGANGQRQFERLPTTSNGNGTGATVMISFHNTNGSIGNTRGSDYDINDPGVGHAADDVLTVTNKFGGATSITLTVDALITDNSVYHDKVRNSKGTNGLYTEIYECTLDTPWDIRSSLDSAVPAQFRNLQSQIYTGSLGTVVDTGTDGHNETAKSQARANVGKVALDFTFNQDGTEMYVLDFDSSNLQIKYSDGISNIDNKNIYKAVFENIRGFTQEITRYKLNVPFVITTASASFDSAVATPTNVDIASGFEKKPKGSYIGPHGGRLHVVGSNGIQPYFTGSDIKFNIFETPFKLGSSSTSKLNTYDMSSNPKFDSDLGEISFRDLVVESTKFGGFEIIGLIPFKQEDGSIYYAILINGSSELKIGTMSSGIPYLSQKHELPIVNAWKSIFIDNKDKPSNQKKIMVEGYMQNSSFNMSSELMRYLQYWYENPGMVARPTSSR